jgi:hypothetical protein
METYENHGPTTNQEQAPIPETPGTVPPPEYKPDEKPSEIDPMPRPDEIHKIGDPAVIEEGVKASQAQGGDAASDNATMRDDEEVISVGSNDTMPAETEYRENRNEK